MITQSRCQWQCTWMITALNSASLYIKAVICLSSTFQAFLWQNAIYPQSYLEHIAHSGTEHADSLTWLSFHHRHTDICNFGLQRSNAARVIFFCLSSVVFAASPVTPAASPITAGPHIKKENRGVLLCLGITFSAEPKVKETAALCIKKSERRCYMLSHIPESAAARSILAITIPPREVYFDSTI